MHLPNGEFAVVSLEKLRNYCLNTNHPRGKHKARVFATALDMTVEDAEELREMLLVAARTQETEMGFQDEFGQRYVVDMKIVGTYASVTLRSIWIIRNGEEIPHLVTCYLL